MKQYTVEPPAQMSVGNYFGFSETQFGVVEQILETGQLLVCWHDKPEPKAKPRKSTQRVNTMRKHGNGYIIAADTMDAVNEAYGGER